MLIEDLYTVEEQQAEEDSIINFKIKLNKAHKIFAGHFPEQPVLPGVCQVEMVKELLQKAYEKDVRLMNASNIKYIEIVDPNKNEYINFKLIINEHREGLKVSAISSFEDGTPNFKFSGLFD